MWPQSTPGILGARPGQPPFLATAGTAQDNFVVSPPAKAVAARLQLQAYNSTTPGLGYGSGAPGFNYGSSAPVFGYGSGAPAADPTASWNQAARQAPSAP